MSPHDEGTHQEWRVGGRGMTALSQILSDESLSYSLKHISTGELSLHISWRSTHLLHLYFPFSWWRHQMETCSASLAFVRGIHPWLRGIHRSPVNSPHIDQWRGALMFSLICAWTNGLVNNQDAGDLRRDRSHYDHCNMVPNSDPVIRAAVGSVILLRFLRRGHADDGCSCNHRAVPPSVSARAVVLQWAYYQTRKIAGCACTRNAGNVFPATAGKRSRHASRHVRGARAVMHVRIAN